LPIKPAGRGGEDLPIKPAGRGGRVGGGTLAGAPPLATLGARHRIERGTRACHMFRLFARPGCSIAVHTGVRLIPHGYDMPHYLDAVAAGPWVLAVVFVVAGLDALLPFMPSESTVVACGVAAASTGRPHLALLIAAASTGAYVGDVASFRIGRRSTGTIEARLSHRRARALHAWVHRLLHSRGGLVIVFARYLPGGRSTTALAAGVVGYPAVRFGWYTAVGVVLWSIEASLIGYLGGTVFTGHPVLGFLLAAAVALAMSGLAVLVQHVFTPAEAKEDEPVRVP
jgi:membrane-associated protein